MGITALYALLKPFFTPLKLGWKVVRKGVSGAKAKLLRPHEERATELYLRSYFHDLWEPLTTSVEYCVHFADVASVRFGDRSYIRFRRRAGCDTRVESLSVRLYATEREITRQQVIEIDLDSGIAEWPLTSLPLLEIYRYGDGLYQTIHDYRVRVISVTPSTEIPAESLALDHHPVCRYINEHFARRGEDFVNLTVYAHAQVELGSAIRYVLLRPDEGLSHWRGALWWTPREALVRLLTWEPVLRSLFWTLVVTRLVRVEEDSRIRSGIAWITAARLHRLFHSDRCHRRRIRRPAMSRRARWFLQEMQRTRGAD
ncbi:MAG: hypothetical protein AVDCRST_MAG68-2417 [uncultured Gemmatimonadetes bacterium]|uniref:Uncharacterized protein n=1 Tax=uncultured Gemmatimonadota bacterium TaxID=203437 RepID=A0A6J4LEF8_9BACT|nr:MAG: hypothetical protein AVDCRST_MAG68-2417 [uncultured Gemmatimonadota bacterium]